MTTPAIEIEGLSIRLGDRVLLERADLEVARGELVLLVGLSGSGKSITLKLLNGLLERDRGPFAIAGHVRICGEELPGGARRHAGIVFQDFGLFDEWSSRENLLFGRDHGRARGADRERIADELLREFKLEAAPHPTALSGGMKQRLALARVLAQDPEIIFYDEPTSGLDPAMSAQVAERIRRTNDEHGKTSFVVTHDLESLAGIADRIVLLDPVERRFRELDRAEVEGVMRGLKPIEDGDTRTRRRPLAARALAFLEGSGRALEAGLITLASLLPRWPRARWGFRYLLYYLRLTSLGSALLYVGICGFILGLIVTWFTFSFLPFKEFTEPLLIDNVIGAIGFSLYRIMSPGMVAMLVAARSGAAIAADVGNRVYSRQTEALRSFGVRPERYLLTNVLWAQLLGMPLLCAVNFLAARLASLIVFAAIKPEYSTWFWSNEFSRFLAADGRLWEGSGWLAAKCLLSAFGVGSISVFLGLRPKESGRDVAGAVTRSIIWGTLFVLLVQTIAALMEFEPI
ncbi:MAG: ABC transporter permease [Planctomycetes bacterium]|nr:ABC transporter permease [Planctomycetota bacterium]